LAVWVITILALVVRLLTATWTGLTTDEANGVSIAIAGSWADLIRHLKEDGNGPLVSTLLRVYALAFGHSDLAMKLLFIGISTLQIPVSYWICRRFLDKEMSLQAAFMIALCPQLVRYGTMIRSYALISILGLFSTWACMRVLGGTRGLIWPVAYGVSTALLVYGHYWGGLLAAGQAFLAATGALRRWFDPASLKRWLAGVAVSFLIFLPWVPILLYQLGHDMSPWDLKHYPSEYVAEMVSYVLVGSYYSLDPFDQFALAFSSFVVFLVLISPRVLITERFNGLHWKIVAASGYLAGLLVSLFVPALRDRYLTVFAPPFIIAYLTGFHALFPRLPALARIVIPVAIWLPLWIPNLQFLHSEPETGTPALVAEIEREADRQKDLVVISWPIIVPTITFYLPDNIAVTCFPDNARTKINRWDGMIDRVRDDRNLWALLKRMEQTLSSGGKIWLIDRAHPVVDRDYAKSEGLGKLIYLDAELYRMDQIRTWLDHHAQQLGKNRLAPGRDFSVFLAVYQPRAPKEVRESPARMR